MENIREKKNLINKYTTITHRLQRFMVYTCVFINYMWNLIIARKKKIVITSKCDIRVNTNDNSLKLLRSYHIIRVCAIKPHLFPNGVYRRGGNVYQYNFLTDINSSFICIKCNV